MSTIAFARGVPAPEMLPIRQITDSVSSALAADATTILSYGTGGGYAPLRQLLAEQHGVSPSQIVVTSGSLQGFALLIEHLASTASNDSSAPLIAVENPTYDRPLLLLDRFGCRHVGIAMDSDGIIPSALESQFQIEPPALLYLIPTFQNPAGSTLTADRRLAVLDLCAQYGVPVLEDDPYGALWFDQPAPARMIDIEHDASVYFSGSFSKVISPGLRVGYLVLPEPLAASIERLANDTYISASLLGQAAVNDFLRAGHLEPTLRGLREMLSDRCTRMCAAIDREFPEAEYHRPDGGYFLWLRLGSGIVATDLLKPANELGVTFVAGASFGEGHENAIRLAFSSPPIDHLDEGIKRIAAAAQTIGTTATVS